MEDESKAFADRREWLIIHSRHTANPGRFSTENDPSLYVVEFTDTALRAYLRPIVSP